MGKYSYGCHAGGQPKATVYKQGLLASCWTKILQEPQRCRVAMVFSSLVEENRLVLFPRNAFSQAAQGTGLTWKQKLPSARRNRDASSHLLWDQGRGTAGDRQLPDSWHCQQRSSLHHCRCLGSRCIWDTSTPTLMLSNKEWNVGCFWGTGTTLPKKH